MMAPVISAHRSQWVTEIFTPDGVVVTIKVAVKRVKLSVASALELKRHGSILIAGICGHCASGVGRSGVVYLLGNQSAIQLSIRCPARGNDVRQERAA
jgi:hypothetical protein